ncbi:hypothetical protein [Roseivirga pacifica]|uniref:hypothetical protein n=1 Tax=Roseivirga pacifica TaxID=1267423 RepID=UPI003BB1A2DF
MKQLRYILCLVLLVSGLQSANAQWRWGRNFDYDRLDTVISIPKYNGNELFIDDDDFYLRVGFLGLELEIEDDWDRDWRYDRRRSRFRNIEYYQRHDHGTLRGLDFEIGLNNYLEDGDFPSSSDLYRVKPINSVYVGLMYNHTTYVSGPLYLNWGGGLNWYNYKFENAATRIDSNGNQLSFIEDTDISSAIKSKLKVTYLTFKAVPMFDFGRGKRLVREYEEGDVRVAISAQRGFRIGVGPYVGLRLGNKAKYVYKNDSGRQKDKEKDSSYVNDFRYGLRMQMGINRFDMFVSYDFNTLFEDGQGPALNPITIGVTF